jgi:hypothetical protein
MSELPNMPKNLEAKTELAPIEALDKQESYVDHELEIRCRDLRAELEARVASKSFDNLLALYPDAPKLPTVTAEMHLDLGARSEMARERLSMLRDFAKTHWDYRKGQERQGQQVDDVLDHKPEVTNPHEPGYNPSAPWNVVFDATREFGMVDSTQPKYSHYDMLIVLGGANRAPLQRTEYGLEQGVDVDAVALLGSDRPVNDAERQKAVDYAPQAQTEFDLMDGAAQTAIGVERRKTLTLSRVGYDHDDSSIPRVNYYRTRDNKSVFTLNAPTRPGMTRANTDDTYALLRTAAGKSRLYPGAKVLVVTNAFVSAFQAIDAKRNIDLMTGAETDTIGYDAAYGGVNRLPSQLLQETLSYIDSLVKLQDSLDKVETDNSASQYKLVA